jgi:hypothetical protein
VYKTHPLRAFACAACVECTHVRRSRHTPRIHTHTHAHTYIHTLTHTHTHTLTHTHAHTHAHTHTRSHTQADGRQPTGAAVDSARQNLASTFVNGFINAGFGHDKLVTAPTEGQVCVYVCVHVRAYVCVCLCVCKLWPRQASDCAYRWAGVCFRTYVCVSVCLRALATTN